MLLLLLTFGSFMFWFSVVFFFVLLTCFTTKEMEGASFISLVIFVCFLLLFTDVHTKDFWSSLNWYQWCLVGASYFVIGFVWARIKFHFYTHKMNRVILKLKEDWKKNNNDRVKRGEKSVSWEFYKKDDYNAKDLRSDLKFEKCSKKILNWAGYWPCSVIEFILNDFVRKAFRYIYEEYLVGIFKRSFQRNIENVWNDEPLVEERFPKI